MLGVNAVPTIFRTQAGRQLQSWVVLVLKVPVECSIKPGLHVGGSTTLMAAILDQRT